MHERMNRKGFTLIELLVVIAVIALLMSIIMPALQKSRQQAKMLICAVKQRSILQALNAWVSDNGGNKLPPSTQGRENAGQPGGVWWTIPMRLKYYYRHSGELNGGSTIEVLGSYMEDPQNFLCPLQRNDVEWLDKWASSYDDQQVALLNSAYMLWWNYLRFVDYKDQIQGRVFNPTYGHDTLMVTDIFMTGGSWNGADNWISGHPFRGAELDKFVDGTAYQFDNNINIFKAPMTVEPRAKLNCGYLDGHVESIDAGRFENELGVLYLPNKWR